MEEFKVAIVAINAKYIHSALAPWCLAAGIRQYAPPQISAAVVEGTINEPCEAILQKIIEHDPRVVGLSCYIWNTGTMGKLIPLLRERLPKAILVLGGPEVSYQPEQVLEKYPQADYVICGEGEMPFARLVTALLREEEPGAIPGLWGGQVFSSPHVSRETPPSPYSPAYFDQLGGRIAYLETSRGCPFSCAFCLSGRCGGLRCFPLERALEELVLLANSGTQTVKLVDRTFNANEERAEKIVEFITAEYGKKIPKGICFHFEIAGDILSENLLAAFSRCPPGAVQLEIGLQSFNEETLAACTRKTDTRRLRSNIARLLEIGNIHIHLDLIAGLPKEDLASFRQSFDTAFSLHPHMLQLGFLKILKGSPMGEEPERFPCTYDPQAPYTVRSTPWLSPEDIALLKGVESALDRLFNSGRFEKSLEYLAETAPSPFELFLKFSRFAGELGGMSLIRCGELFFDCFAPESDPQKLRDLMVEDWLSREPKLPYFLRAGEKPGQLLAKLEEKAETKKKEGLRRSAALLSTREILFVDYQEKNPVTGKYTVQKG